MIFDSICLLVLGLFLIIYAVKLKNSPRKRYFKKESFTGELFVHWRKKEDIFEAIFLNLFQFESYPFAIHIGLLAIIFSLIFILSPLPKEQYQIKSISFQIFVWFILFLSLFPKIFFKKNKKSIMETIDLELYEKFYKGEIEISPKISIVQGWRINFWLLIAFVISASLIPSFREPYLSLNTLFSTIITLSASITIGFLEKQAFHYNFIKKPKIWTKYIRIIRITDTVSIILLTYISIITILFYPEIKL